MSLFGLQCGLKTEWALCYFTTMSSGLSVSPIERTRIRLLECHPLPIVCISPTQEIVREGKRESILIINLMILLEIITVGA